MARKPGRPKTGQNTLTRAQILDAALNIVDKQGVDALSMRQLAMILGVDAMAIYYHLPSKKAIIGGLVERMLQDFQLTPSTDLTWQEQLKAFAKAYREMAFAHANLMMSFVQDTEYSAEGVLRINEVLYTILRSAGLTPLQILYTGDTVIDFLNGFALGERTGRLEQPGERSGVLPLLQAEHRTMRWVFENLTQDEMRSNFEAQFDILVAGIEGLNGTG